MTASESLPIVAILDSGINGLACVANFSGCQNDDSLRHGTAMYERISQADCQILNVKVTDDKGLCWPSNLAAGIVWAVAQGANYINISVSLPSDETGILAEAVAYALSRGVVIVAASIDGYPSYPACLPGVIGVQANGNGTASEATAFKTFTLVNQKGIR